MLTGTKIHEKAAKGTLIFPGCSGKTEASENPEPNAKVTASPLLTLVPIRPPSIEVTQQRTHPHFNF